MSSTSSAAQGRSFAAVDLGATSGRVIVGTVVGEPGAERVELTEVGRFPNEPVLVPATRGDERAVLTWDVPALWRGILAGLRDAVARFGPLAGIGIDSWAVDYGMVDGEGRLLGNPTCYRDTRTEPVLARVFDLVSAADQYAVNGLQVQPFTTAFQLLAETRLEQADRVLLLPDLLGAWLTGVERAEITNASTTGLLDAASRTWSTDLAERLGLPARVLPELVAPGELLGRVRPGLAAVLGVPDGELLPVWTVGSHDTASAVVAVPMDRPDAAYISCGTWSLVGLELDEPVLTEASRAANVTNEAGVDATIRYLKNVMGLWVLTETMRGWAAAGREVPLGVALAQAATVEPLRTVVDIDHASLLPPGDMPARLASLARATGQPVPESVGEVVRCILDSLALAYRRAVREVSALADRSVAVVHVVGGGVHNEALMQLAADAIGVPVVTGPAEGAALGNVLVQARAAGVLHGTLGDLRRVVERSTPLRRYEPGAGEVSTSDAWDDAERRAHP